MNIRGIIETISTTALLKSTEYSKESMRHEISYCYSNSRENEPAKDGVKNSKQVNEIILIKYFVIP